MTTQEIDLASVDEFFKFLQGIIPEGIYLKRGHKPKLSPKQAYAIIWYLQEHLSVFSDTIERCYHCGELFDSGEEDLYWESKGRTYCGGCLYSVPEHYDRGKR